MASDPGEPRAQVVWLLSLCRFAESIAVGMLIPVLPLYLEGLETPTLDSFFARLRIYLPELGDLNAAERTGILFSATGLAMALIQIVSGRLSDALDRRKPFILFGMVGAALCGSSYVRLDTYGELLFARVLQGIFMGMTFPPLMALLAHHTPAGRGGRTLGTYTTIRLIGFACGPLVGGVMADWGGYDATFLTSVGLLGVSAMAVTIWIPDHRDHPEPGVPRPAAPPVPFVFRLLGATLFLMMVGISAIISLFPVYRAEFGATEAQLGLVFAAFIATRGLLQYPMGWLGDELDKKWVLLCALGLFIPIVALQGQVASVGQLVAVRVGIGAVTAAISVCITGISAERSLPGNRARVMGINTFSFSLGVAVGPLLGGFLSAQPPILFMIPAAGTLMIGVLIAIYVPPDGRQRGLDHQAEPQITKPSPQSVSAT